VQHAASAAAGFVSGALLTKAHGRIIGMPQIAVINMALTVAIPLMLRVVETGVRRRSHTKTH
jgi:hypothetical protein